VVEADHKKGHAVVETDHKKEHAVVDTDRSEVQLNQLPSTSPAEPEDQCPSKEDQSQERHRSEERKAEGKPAYRPEWTQARALARRRW
jgi:hypothetical protein